MGSRDRRDSGTRRQRRHQHRSQQGTPLQRAVRAAKGPESSRSQARQLKPIAPRRGVAERQGAAWVEGCARGNRDPHQNRSGPCATAGVPKSRVTGSRHAQHPVVVGVAPDPPPPPPVTSPPWRVWARAPQQVRRDEEQQQGAVTPYSSGPRTTRGVPASDAWPAGTAAPAHAHGMRPRGSCRASAPLPQPTIHQTPELGGAPLRVECRAGSCGFRQPWPTAPLRRVVRSTVETAGARGPICSWSKLSMMGHAAGRGACPGPHRRRAPQNPTLQPVQHHRRPGRKSHRACIEHASGCIGHRRRHSMGFFGCIRASIEVHRPMQNNH